MAGPIPKIIFEDTHLLVIDKPAGLLSQGDHSEGPNVVDWLRERLGRPYVGLVHRLDRNTSGLMVVAKRSKSANRLTEALQNGELKRRYQAWIIGALKEPCLWKHWLVKDRVKNEVRALTVQIPGAQSAELKIRPLGTGQWTSQGESLSLTLAEFELLTGRSHQIRVQSTASGFPLLGDTKYTNNTVARVSQRFGRPALHSSFLSFPHPMSGELQSYELPLPEDMASIKLIQPKNP